ncbi:hypothetical protein SDC9_82326 [bioreactor metagenome]|uniref:Uncharacterized protein n=1 Tax=bioreactor metagenome TaxID=1076179 RepID=A0A644ZAJ6_9ZZZZ
MIFGIRDTGLYGTGLVSLFIKSHFFEYGTDETFTICRIINGKTRVKPQMFCFGT